MSRNEPRMLCLTNQEIQSQQKVKFTFVSFVFCRYIGYYIIGMSLLPTTYPFKIAIITILTCYMARGATSRFRYLQFKHEIVLRKSPGGAGYNYSCLVYICPDESVSQKPMSTLSDKIMVNVQLLLQSMSNLKRKGIFCDQEVQSDN